MGSSFALSIPPFNAAAGHADLVQDVPVCSDHGIVGLAAQDIDGAAGKVAVLDFAGEQRPGSGIGDAPSASSR